MYCTLVTKPASSEVGNSNRTMVQGDEASALIVDKKEETRKNAINQRVFLGKNQVTETNHKGSKAGE